MTNDQLKELEDKLWDSANSLRAYGGLKASDYAVPVLGLIFLKFADNKYRQFEPAIKREFEESKGTRMEEPIDKIALQQCGFYLPDIARYEYLLNLPSKDSTAKALKAAMEAIELYQDEKMKGVLPKDAYMDIETKKSDILPELLKTFSNIPADASGDIFGKIYEYFLGKFAKSEGQKGGEFFTPTSVVRFIVEVIEPYIGKLYDPACGSGGMFVQSASFLRKIQHELSDIYVYGQEYMGETVRLAKMNLLVNNLRGDIAEVNSYAADPYKSLGKFDYVMANPPFNVKSVKEATVKDDERFTAFGLPKSKGKKADNITDANYLWISLFAQSLNEKGRAGFVMANSASDARNAEYEIRKKIVDTGMVDCMVSMPSNMFLTVTLPATLWFFDKAKINSKRKDQILFLDARNVFKQIDRAHREWTDEHQQNLATIVRLYRGEKERFKTQVQQYLQACIDQLPKTQAQLKAYHQSIETEQNNLNTYYEGLDEKRQKKLKQFTDNSSQLTEKTVISEPKTVNLTRNDLGHGTLDALAKQLETRNKELETLKASQKALNEKLLWSDKHLKQKADKDWSDLQLGRAAKRMEEAQAKAQKAYAEAQYWWQNAEWLLSRFPKGEYQDVTGLCKVAHKSEYAEEQDYSLNPGRYVGVVIEDDHISEEEFKNRINSRLAKLELMNSEAQTIEKSINEKLRALV